MIDRSPETPPLDEKMARFAAQRLATLEEEIIPVDAPGPFGESISVDGQTEWYLGRENPSSPQNKKRELVEDIDSLYTLTVRDTASGAVHELYFDRAGNFAHIAEDPTTKQRVRVEMTPEDFEHAGQILGSIQQRHARELEIVKSRS